MAWREIGALGLTGNVIPNAWFHHIRKNDAPHLLAIVVLSEIVYWFRPVEMRHHETGLTTNWKKKFAGEAWQISQSKLAQKFGTNRKRISEALDFLESEGLICQRKHDSIEINGRRWGNVLFVLPVPSAIRHISYTLETNCPKGL